MSEPLSDGPAEEALRGALQSLGAEGGVLFEQVEPNGPFVPTASLGLYLDAGLEFQPNSLLPRWLRVNQLALPIPDRIGIYDRLAPFEADALTRLGLTLAAPLMVDQSMAGWLAVAFRAAHAGQAQPVPDGFDVLAGRLHAERERARSLARGEMVSRSNRLALAGQMAAGVAHEVRNPLAAVRSIVQMVQSEVPTDTEHSAMLTRVLVEVDRVNGVLTGMLSLGRPTAGRTELIDVSALVRDAIAFCQAYARSRSQTIAQESEAALMVVGDPHELRQVFVNILLNACQASESDQTVFVNITRVNVDDRPHAQVRCVDSGAGIPTPMLEKIFEPFFSTKPNGGGLGLSLCREAMQRHNGDIVVASRVGDGTAVTLRLPLAEANA